MCALIGVLLLNACLTVRANQANSHKEKVLNEEKFPVVFLLTFPVNYFLIFSEMCFLSYFRVGKSLQMQLSSGSTSILKMLSFSYGVLMLKRKVLV